jgi:hypothetical protein
MQDGWLAKPGHDNQIDTVMLGLDPSSIFFLYSVQVPT